ncbi:MAG: hypothetical protein FXF49_08070 [Flexistipes sinusarabici]|uniref:DNA-binding protein n=1 Tax=Flexistipes sinusarabici TaxID=2352 RepID=A0A5D0MMB7_FLESI|nr:hypothetical protein [Flexistipes sinusarabici]TYB33095.1 MAG: hypothetical protein FXF49_08070 [Flexistipes sinusarabici]
MKKYQKLYNLKYSDLSKVWGLSEGTLRNWKSSGVFKQGRDYVGRGKTIRFAEDIAYRYPDFVEKSS